MPSKILILLICGICSLSSLGYELSLSLYVSRLTGYEIWGQSFTLGVYLICMGAGSYFYEQKKLRFSYSQFLLLEITIFLLGILTPLYLEITNSILTLTGILNELNPFRVNIARMLLVAFIPTCAIGFLTGMELPIIFQKTKRHELNLVVFFSYCGSLLAGLIVAKFLMDGLSYFTMFIIFSSLNLQICFMITIIEKKYFRLIMITPLALLTFGVIEFYPEVNRYYKKITYYNFTISDFSKENIRSLKSVVNHLGDIQTVETPYQTIDLVKVNSLKPKRIVHELYLNSNIQFNTAKEHIYHETFVHGAFNLINKIPKKVTILGGGDGILAAELLKYKSIKEIKIIELDSKIVEFSSENLVMRSLNRGSFHDYRVKIINEDAFSYISKQPENSAELILIDFPYPNSNDLKKLFSFEFYSFVKKVIGAKGYAILDAPLYRESESGKLVGGTKTIYSTLYYTGFNTLFSFGPYTPFIIISNQERKLSFNYELFSENEFISNSTLLNLVKIEYDYSNFLPIDFKYINSILKPGSFINE